ncbi:MAG TPA: alanine--glyoxylate aminotransferase family protein [Bacteroidota bacterium]|nr:alanine--glyoxylate aminotransferase family protein [Bacteroidota bacterium]
MISVPSYILVSPNMKNRKLLMIPGPSPVARSIQDQMGRETIAFGDPAFVDDFRLVLADLKAMWKTSGEVFVVAGTGTLAMEMAIANSTRRGDNVLVVSHGYFGDRYAEICRRKGLAVDVLSSEWGKAVPVSTIESKLSGKRYRAVTVTHVDTSTGVCADVEKIGARTRKHSGLIFIVDGVCATAAEPESVDEMGIDILFTGSQKAFGISPGLAMLWAGPRAMERRRELGAIPEYYVDFEQWLPVMHDPSKYFATPAVNLVWALKEAVRIIQEEGLEARCLRHRKSALAVQSALEAIGFGILAEPGHRASTLSGVLYKGDMDDLRFRKTLAEEGVQVSAGLGEYAGKMFRLGHMGNIDTHDLVSVIAAIERTLARLGKPIEPGKGIAALTKGLL